MNTNNLYIFLFVFFIILIIAYIFGMSMINLIDSRINNLNNKNDNKIQEFFTNNQKSNISPIEINEDSVLIQKSSKVFPFSDKSLPKSIVIEPMSIANYNLNNDEITLEKFKTNFDQDYYKNMYKDAKIEGFTDEPEKSFQIWEFEKKHQEICQEDHLHQKDRTNTKCSYGVTNYADPKDLAAVDLTIFMLNYPTNMTLQDYINWLYCFKDKEDELPYNHLKNLKKLKNGIKLIPEPGILPPPSYYYPPLNSEDYFNKLYNSENEINIAPALNSNTSSIMPFNGDNYSTFSQNFDVNGTTGKLRNDDIDVKKNTRFVNEFVNGVDSFHANNTQIYNKYRRKKIEN
jgi:hypothetical protein